MDRTGDIHPIRIIPRLDIKGPNLVKGVQMEGLRVLGSPYQFAGKYYRDGADELIYMDVEESLYGCNRLLPLIERTAKDIFITLTVVGEIRSVEDVRDVLNIFSRFDKLHIGTYSHQIREDEGATDHHIFVEIKPRVSRGFLL